jgi:hypothetical protein
MRGRRRLHRQVADDLQQVVLNDVADDAGLVVELAAPFDAEAFGERDLDVLDVVPVPDRFEKRVREPEVQEVLHRLLAEVMVDPEDVVLRERAAKNLIELAGRGEIVPERLFHDDPCVRRAVRPVETLDNRRKHGRGDREVVRGQLRALQFALQLRERVRVGVVAVDVPEPGHERGEGFRVLGPVFLHGCPGALHELIERPA